MSDDDIKITIIELYEKNQQRLSGNSKYTFALSDKRNEYLDKFIDRIKKEVAVVGVDLLRSYLSYAFGTYAGRGVKTNPSAFYCTWIISFTLFKKFLNDSSGKKWYVKKTLRHERHKLIATGRDVGEGKKKVKAVALKVNFETSIEREQRVSLQRTQFTELNDLEEEEKERYFNTTKGRIWCIDFTTLYNGDSSFCKKCKFKEGCKETLKTELPNLYKMRNG